MRVAGTSVHYKLVLPDGHDAAQEYPAVLVMGGGPQTMDTVDRTLERNFRAEAERRGYIVVAPAAPDGELFFQGGERIFPEFLDTILANHKIAGGKFHVAGPSNGGIAAMHVAAQHPRYFPFRDRVPRLFVAAEPRTSSERCRSSAYTSTSARPTNISGTMRCSVRPSF